VPLSPKVRYYSSTIKERDHNGVTRLNAIRSTLRHHRTYISSRPLTVEGNYTEWQKIRLESETTKIKKKKKRKVIFTGTHTRDWKDGMARACAIKTVNVSGALLLQLYIICLYIYILAYTSTTVPVWSYCDNV